MSWLSCVISNVALASLLTVGAWIFQRRRQAAVARALCVLALIKLLTPPLASLPVRELPGTVACALGVCRCGPHAPASWFALDALPWVLIAVWFIGAAVSACAAWRRWAQFQQLTAHAVQAPRRWQALAAKLGDELRLRRPPEILTVPGRLPPLVIAGWRRPRILLPQDLIYRLNGSQRKALLMHELVHVQRLDHLVRILESAVRLIYWWLPLVNSIGRRLRDCEETCCDAAVLARLPQSRRNYARLLLDVIDFAEPPTVSQATAMSAAHDLERRLRAILDDASLTRRIRPVGMLAVAAACGLLPCQLTLDVGQRPARASAGRVPAADAPLSPGSQRAVEIPAGFGCAS